MRAIEQTGVGGADVLKVTHRDDPVPRRGQVLLRVRAAAVNFHDVERRRRGEPGMILPMVPGTDVAGDVAAVGPGVDSFEIGQRVVAIIPHGGYAELAVAPAHLTRQLPDDLSFEQAAACPVAGLTAAFLSAYASPGSTIAAYAAAGSVGCFLGGLVRDQGVHGIAIVSSAEKARIAIDAGYEHAVVHTEDDVVAAVKALTKGRGADLVLDSVAGPRVGRSFRMARCGGTVVLFGKAGGEPDMGAVATDLLAANRNLALRTFFLSRAISEDMSRVGSLFDGLFARLIDGRVRIPLERVDLEHAADAQCRVERGATVGKLVLVP